MALLPYAWRPLLPEEHFEHDFETPPPVSVGYCFAMVPRGHAHCGCLLSKTTRWYKKHDPATGPWPNHFAVADVYVERLLREQPDFVPKPGCSASASYGFIQSARAHERQYRRRVGPY